MGQQIGDTIIRDDGSIGSRSDPTETESDSSSSSVPDYGSVTRDRDGDPLSGTDADSGSDRGTPDYGTDDNTLPGGNLAGGSSESESDSPTPEQLDNLGSQLQENVMQQFEDRFSNSQQDFNESVQQLEDQFNSEISQTEANFNDQIDSVSESFTSVGSNLQSGIESTQNAVGSLSGSLARLVSQDSEDSQGSGEGLPTNVIALGAAAIAAVGYYVTQRDQ